MSYYRIKGGPWPLATSLLSSLGRRDVCGPGCGTQHGQTRKTSLTYHGSNASLDARPQNRRFRLSSTELRHSLNFHISSVSVTFPTLLSVHMVIEQLNLCCFHCRSLLSWLRAPHPPQPLFCCFHPFSWGCCRGRSPPSPRHRSPPRPPSPPPLCSSYPPS